MVKAHFCILQKKIEENGLYLLDEPENSLSPKRQIELTKFIEDSARFFWLSVYYINTFAISTCHDWSKIYDLDENPVDVKRWTELENVRTYYEFFKKI